MTEAREEVLKRVPYVYYPMQFRKDLSEIKALIDLGSEVNAISPVYANKLGLRIQKTDVRARKIDGSSLDTFGVVIAGF